jgi:hypothetical protein
MVFFTTSLKKPKALSYFYEQDESGEFVETDTEGEFALIVEGNSMKPEFHLCYIV